MSDMASKHPKINLGRPSKGPLPLWEEAATKYYPSDEIDPAEAQTPAPLQTRPKALLGHKPAHYIPT